MSYGVPLGIGALVTVIVAIGVALPIYGVEGKGPFTVFAPTDVAFAKVPKSTLTTLAKNKAKLRAVLLYHVVKGTVTAARR